MRRESLLRRLWDFFASLITRWKREPSTPDIGGAGARLKMLPGRLTELRRLERAIGVRFRDLTLVNQAMAHRSYVYAENLKGTHSNERMELLGDAVLALAVNDYLYRAYPDRREGYLTALKSMLVSKAVLARTAREIGLGRYILLSNQEKRGGGMKRSSILSDAFEALIAAIYLDCGLDTAKKFIVRHLAGKVQELVKDAKNINYKSLLQEFVQDRGQASPRYRIIREEGPEHAKKFTVEVYIDNRRLGRGTGRSKKTAEQRSAREALLGLDQL